MKFVTQDYYEILNVAPGASSEEVKRAYRMVRKSFRPDSMAIHSLYSEEETEAISAKIDEAFRLLSDPESARRYGKYNRSGRAGMSIPRDPDQFFDLVHDLDGSSAIEELAQQVAASRDVRLSAVQPRRPAFTFEEEPEDDSDGDSVDVTAPGIQLPLILTRRPGERGLGSTEAVAQAEVFIDSLEEVPVPGAAVASVPSATRAPTPGSPAVIRTPAGPQLGRRTMDVPVPQVAAPVRARVDPTARVLPGATVSPDATTLAAAPAVSAEQERRTWIRDTVSTRAVGPIEVSPLPREEIEALEMDCGGVSGEFLQQVRREMNISLQDIATRTKIGIGMLRHIEADELDRLPARVYLKGYLNQICRMLRLPTPQIPEKYLRRHGI